MHWATEEEKILVFIVTVLLCQRRVMSKLRIILTYFEKVVDLICSS